MSPLSKSAVATTAGFGYNCNAGHKHVGVGEIIRTDGFQTPWRSYRNPSAGVRRDFFNHVCSVWCYLVVRTSRVGMVAVMVVRIRLLFR